MRAAILAGICPTLACSDGTRDEAAVDATTQEAGPDQDADDSAPEPPADQDAAVDEDAEIAPDDDASVADAEIDGGGEDAASPCTGVPASGRCAGARAYELCTPSDESAAPSLQRIDCTADEHCDDSSDKAKCVPDGACSASEARCKDAQTLETCASGAFTARACEAGCVEGPLGPFCRAQLATTSFQATLRYERRAPNLDRSDWSATLEPTAASGLAVLSYRGDALVDAATTSSQPGALGEFSLRVPDPLATGDALVILAAGGVPGTPLAYAVADPGFTTSDTAHSPLDEPADPRIWSWRYDLTTLTPTATLTITEALGAGAVHSFASLRAIFSLGQETYAPAQPQTLVVWFGLGTAWTCGACYAARPTTQFGVRFLHQLRVDGSSDQEYWSESVTRHELGHYIMSAFGYAPREVGPRFLGSVTNPGLAWAEGWATFFSCMQRADPIFYDKQQGVFFWWDIEARRYSQDDPAWQRAAPDAGLTQPIDENEVSAMLWGSYRAIGASEPLLSALASDRVRVPPFERGYTRRTWSDADHPENYTDTGEPHPFLADFLDALRCSEDLSSAQTDAITEPALHYPYPSDRPLCR